MKLMIVDDSEPIRRMIASYLDDLVDAWVECEDGSKAMAVYSEHLPDIVLMDITMKLTDAFEATRKIKKAFPAARIFTVSQWDRSELRDLVKRSAANAYVSKRDLVPLGYRVKSESQT